MLTAELASRFAALALGHVTREYPNKLDHVLFGPGDARSPRALHPIFYGSFDWHSCVHGYWLLATILRRFPTIPEAPRIRTLFDDHLTAENVRVEAAYLSAAGAETFERPYGWAWLLALAAELHRHDGEHARWDDALAPLAAAVVRRYTAYLPKVTYPVRAGTHANGAFALALADDYADRYGDTALSSLVRTTARAWFGDDVDGGAWEPSGEDFLSPALAEAECMRRVLPHEEFLVWLERFLPRIARREPPALFAPATVRDRTDGRLAHLDGLNLSRAWCMRSIAAALPAADVRRDVLLAAAAQHLAAALPQLAVDYAGEHWLATFAALALDTPARDLGNDGFEPPTLPV